MITPRNLLIVAVSVLAFAPLMFSSATNVYITPAGTSQGACTSNPQTPAWFNNAANWGSGSSQIGAGTTVTICGTFTGTAGATELTFQGGGTSGSPVILLFDTNAVLTAPYWSGTNGAINVNGQSYVTINGGSNGIIEDTANGTQLTYQTGSYGIELGNATNVEIKNLTIENLYQRTGTGDEVDATTIRAIDWGTGSANTITIDNNTIHDGGWLLLGNGDNIIIGPNNNLYNADHDYAGAPVHVTIYGNHFHDWGIWDSTSDAYHHDGIHCFAEVGTGNTQLISVYNNQFDGSTTAGIDGAVGMNEFVFLESSSTSCLVSGGTAYIFNNVMIGNVSMPAFFNLTAVGSGQTGSIVANNTMLNNQPSGTGIDENLQTPGVTYVVNNAAGGSGTLVGGNTFPTTLDYNFYENCTSYNCFFIGSIDTSSFATWQGDGYDTHGGASLSSSTYFNLDSGCVPGSVGDPCQLQSGSPLIGAGTNLYSVCNGQPNPGLGALCYDKAGNARPASGAWDVGAYQYAGSAPPPSPPSNLTAVVQ